MTAAAASEASTVRIARALSDPTRFKLLRAIAARPDISCQELVRKLRVAQATVSHHLKILTAAGLVTVRRDGPFHRYHAVAVALAAHARALSSLLGGELAARTRTPSWKGAAP